MCPHLGVGLVGDGHIWNGPGQSLEICGSPSAAPALPLV
jgi:hypothetical protein